MSKRAPQKVLKNPRPLQKSKRSYNLANVKGDYQKGRELLRPMMELKGFDTVINNLVFRTPAGGSSPQVLNAMVNGAELFQRVGRKVYMKSVHIRGLIVPLLTTTNPDLIRILVVYDAQPNAALATIQAVLQDANAGGATSGTSEINLTNRARFSIIRDFQITAPVSTVAMGPVLTSTVNWQDQNSHYSIDFFCKLKGLEAEYNGTNGGTIADISSGSLLIFGVSTANDSSWQFTFSSRLRYYD